MPTVLHATEARAREHAFGHDGQARPGQSVPLSWSDTENVLWSVDVPGRGNGSRFPARKAPVRLLWTKAWV